MNFLKKHHITSFLIITTLISGCFFRLTPEAFADNYAIVIDSTDHHDEVPCANAGMANNDCSFRDAFMGSAGAISFSLAHQGNSNRNFKISIADDLNTIGLFNTIPIQFSADCNNCTIELDGRKSNGTKTKIVPSTTTPPASAFLIGEDIGNITIKNFDFQGFSAPAVLLQSIHNTQVTLSDNSFGQIDPGTQPNNTAIQLADADHVIITNNTFGRQTDNGIAIKGSSSENSIESNLFGIGSATDLLANLPSIGNDAINISEESRNTSIVSNIIANAGRNGISIIGGTGHEIGLNNRFFNNSGLAVAIASRGNNQESKAVLTSAYRSGSAVKIAGTADSQSQLLVYKANNASNPAITPDTQGGEGFRMLQSLVVDSNSDEDPTVGRFLFTLTDPDLILGDTLSAVKSLNHSSSAFSNNIVIADKQSPSITATSSPASPQPGTLVNLSSTTVDSDSSSNQLNYVWTQTAGPTVTLSSPNTADTTFTVPAVTSATALTFTVRVTDETGLSDIATTTVNAQQAEVINRAPIANAGVDQTVSSSSQTQLNGSTSSDPDGDVLTYRWTQATSDSYHVTLNSTTSSRPQFISPAISELQADLHFTLQVTDTHGAQSSDDVIIHITRTKTAPVAILSVRSGTTFSAGTEITLDGSSSTFDSTTSVRQFRFRHIPSNSSDLPLTINQTSSSASLARVTLPSTISATRDYRFELIVNDGTADSAADTVVVQSVVTQPTSTPTATPTATPTSTTAPAPTCSTDLPLAVAGSNITTANTPGKIITLNGSLSTDPHGLPLTYYWRQLAGGPRVDLRNDQSPTPNFTIPTFTDDSLTISFQLTVTNSCNKSNTNTVQVIMGNGDSDNDGLDNATEDRLGTNPNLADTDNDGLADGLEVKIGCTSPTNPDSDNDGIRDGIEDSNHNGITDGGETNPCLADTDHDGMPDGFETTYQLNPLDPRDANEDSDRDGLTNLEEFVYKTNPRDADTDHDGLSDGVEIKTAHTDASKDDTDGDGILDGNEDTNHSGLVDPGETDPNRYDTDGDGLSDGLEIGLRKPQGKNTDLKKFQPDLDALSKTNPLTADTDGDKIIDGNEDTNHNGSFDCGETNPLDPTNKVNLCKAVVPATPVATKQPRVSGISISVNGANTTKQPVTTKQGGIVNLVGPKVTSTPTTTKSPFSITVSRGSGKQTRIEMPTAASLSSISVIPSILLPTTGPALSSILVYAPLFAPKGK